TTASSWFISVAMRSRSRWEAPIAAMASLTSSRFWKATAAASVLMRVLVLLVISRSLKGGLNGCRLPPGLDVSRGSGLQLAECGIDFGVGVGQGSDQRRLPVQANRVAQQLVETAVDLFQARACVADRRIDSRRVFRAL